VKSDPTPAVTPEAGTRNPWKELTMTTPRARKTLAPAIDFSATKAAVWLTLTAFFALLVIYFVGMDQGATSVFGNNTVIHEFVHDARHLLGFPCH